jgi:hypothetical protein
VLSLYCVCGLSESRSEVLVSCVGGVCSGCGWMAGVDGGGGAVVVAGEWESETGGDGGDGLLCGVSWVVLVRLGVGSIIVFL